jgi:hypothetical protein
MRTENREPRTEKKREEEKREREREKEKELLGVCLQHPLLQSIPNHVLYFRQQLGYWQRGFESMSSLFDN